MLGQDGDLDLALLDEKNAVGGFALAKNPLVFLIFLDVLACPLSAKEDRGIEPPLQGLCLQCICHGVGPLRGGSTTLSVTDGGRGWRGDTASYPRYVR